MISLIICYINFTPVHDRSEIYIASNEIHNVQMGRENEVNGKRKMGKEEWGRGGCGVGWGGVGW